MKFASLKSHFSGTVTYHELSMVNTDLPRTSALKRQAKELDKGSVVRPIPGKVMGVQQSLKERLKI